MGHFIFMGCMVSLVTLALVLLFIAGIKTKDSEMITYGAIGSCVCLVLSWLVWGEYDKKLVEAADEFFTTREEVYKCKEHQVLTCQYKIMQWQADSIDWTNRVQKVMRKK